MDSKRLKIKRIRSGNWTNEMKRMLFILVRPRVHIIDSKSNTGEMIEKKLQAWEFIRSTFEQHGYRLTQKQIRDQWCRVKFLARANRVRVKVNSVTPPKEKNEIDFQGEIDSLMHCDGTTSRYEPDGTFTKKFSYIDNGNQSSDIETPVTTQSSTTTKEQKEGNQLFAKRTRDITKVTPPSTPAAIPSPPSSIPVLHTIPSQSAPGKKSISFSHHMYNDNSYSNGYPNSQQNLPPHQDRESHKCCSCPCIAAQESEYDKIGKAWASELQKMKPEQQIYAKRAIAEIIFEGQLSALHRDSVTINHMQQQVTSAPIRSPSPASYAIEKTEPDSDC